MKSLVSIYLLILCSTAHADRPNVVLINIDDLGWSDLGCQGSSYYETPNIDQLASGGMVFAHGYAAASNCAPSRASMLTGQNTPRHGVYTVASSERGKSPDRKLIPTKNTTSLVEDALTIGTLFQRAGYATAAMGKWHVSKNPLQHGFSINIGGTHEGGPYRGGYNSPFEFPNLTVKEKGTYLTDALTDRAIEFVAEHRDEAFFLYLSYFQVHSPLQSKPGAADRFKHKSRTEAHGNAVYAAMIASVDENLGRLFAELDSLGLTKKTLIVFTSDNGGVWRTSRQWPLRAGKGSYYEGGIRVPFFVKWPGKVQAGSTSDTPVSGLDLFPTLVAAAGLEVPGNYPLDGVNLMPLLRGEMSGEERPLYWHFPIYLEADGKSDETRDPRFRTRPGSVIRLGKWKLHEYFEDGTLELYDLSKDVGEQHNLVAQHPEIADSLHLKLKNWREEMQAPVPADLNPAYQP